MKESILVVMIGIVLAFCLAIQIFLSTKKINPFLSLIGVSMLAALLLGMDQEQTMKAFEKGAGTTLGSIALLLVLGAIQGKLLEKSGAAQQIANLMMRLTGPKYASVAVLLAAFIIGIPLYYNAGFILLLPLVVSLSAVTGKSLISLAIPMAAALSVTHCFLPPHPGPVYLVGVFSADMGKTLLYGILISLPAVLVGGLYFPRFLKHLRTEQLTENHSKTEQSNMSVSASLLLALLPVGLILLGVASTYLYFLPAWFSQTLLRSGEPVNAMFISLLVSFYWLGKQLRYDLAQLMVWVEEGVSGIAMILMIITAGGIFRQVLLDSGSTALVASWHERLTVSPLLYAWVLTAFLRVSLGSATIAGITASGLLMPLLESGECRPELLVLAVGAGSVFGSHINDTGFWMFKEFFRLSLKQTFLSWTIMESLVSVLGILGILLVDSLGI